MNSNQLGRGKRPIIQKTLNIYLTQEVEAVLRAMFGEFDSVAVEYEFESGLSGGRVFRVRPARSDGKAQLPAVVKVAPSGLIKQERDAYHNWVENTIPGIARIEYDPILLSDIQWGGLRYALIGGGIFKIQSLYEYYYEAGIEDLVTVLEKRLFQIMGQSWWLDSQTQRNFQMQSDYDALLPVNLLIKYTDTPADGDVTPIKPNHVPTLPIVAGDYVHLTGFVVTEVDEAQHQLTLNLAHKPGDMLARSCRLRLEGIPDIGRYKVGDAITSTCGQVVATRDDFLSQQASQAMGKTVHGSMEYLDLGEGLRLPNPLVAYQNLLYNFLTVRVSTVHRDLNLENILVDQETRDVSLIDFATVRRGHAVHDLLRLETEVMTKLVPEVMVKANLPLGTVHIFYEELHRATSYSSQLAPLELPHADLEKPFKMLVAVRRMACQCLFDQNDWTEYYQGLTLYLLGALKFKNLDATSKQVAFWGAAVACDFVENPPPALQSELELSVLSPSPKKDWKRLQPYLPPDIYQEVQSASPARKAEICIERLNQLLRAVVTYVPRHLALELLQKPIVAQNKGKFLKGTLLFADISGFTSLSEKLKAKGDAEGAEAITQVINDYLDIMLNILFKHNGLLTRFSGDAMLCLFTGEDFGALNAVLAAWEMRQTTLVHFAEIKVLGETIDLGIKVGSNSGLLFAAHVGTTDHMEYVLTGSVVEHTAHAESSAARGDILISHKTHELVKDHLVAEQAATEGQSAFYRLLAIHPGVAIEVEDSWSKIERLLAEVETDLWKVVERLDALSLYLPTGVLSHLVSDSQEGQIEGQHRQVTVLFVNFTGMSDIIEAYGIDNPGGITGCLSEYFRAMQEEIQYYGGVINKVDLYDQGDKLMVIFGAPTAHEKDAQRAALTSLAMQEAMNNLSCGGFLSQRVGINRGFVFAGNVGSSQCHRREYTVMGDDVNLAERLMSASEPGQILVSQSVWEGVQESFYAEALGSIQVAGRSEQVSTYRLQDVRSSWDHRGSREIRSEMVGRDRELKKLQMRFQDLQSRRRKQLVVISGEAGVGKTRLVREWQQWVERTTTDADSSVTWLTGHSHPFAQKANGVFIEVIEQLVGFSADDLPQKRWSKLSTHLTGLFKQSEPGWIDDFRNKLSCLGQFLGLDVSQRKDGASLTAQWEQLDPQTRQLQMRLAVCDLIEHAARERPLVLVLEDLHWADTDSLEILKFVWERIEYGTPILFCLIYRIQKELPIWQTWHEISRRHRASAVIELKELNKTGCRQLLLNLMRPYQVSDELRKLVLSATDGNPLYVEEVLHALIEEEAVSVHEGKEWQLAPHVTRVRVPDTLQQIIQSRIDELDFREHGIRRVLWMASVIGERFDETLLLHLFTSTRRQEPEDNLWKYLNELQVADMIQELGNGEQRHCMYYFRHGLVRQVAYENMLVSKRREYHCEVGRWWEEQYSQELPRHYDILAHHYGQGQQWNKAFEFHRLAGEQNARAYANESAIFHLQRALEIAYYVVPSDGILAQVHFELGKVLATTGKFDDALMHLKRADDLFGGSSEQDATLQRARTCYEIGRILERKGSQEDLEIALEQRHKGLALLPQQPTAEAALLYVLGGIVCLRLGRFRLADIESVRALGMAQATGAKWELATAHRLLSVSLRAQGQHAIAMEHCEHDVEISQELSDLLGLVKGYSNQGVIAFEMDDWQLAQEAYLQALETSERIGDQYQIGRMCCNLADLYCHLGDREKGFAYVHRGLDILDELQVYSGMITARVVLATLRWRRKAPREQDLEQARVRLLEARELAESVAMFKPTVGRWLAQVYLTAGNVAQAEVETQNLLSLDVDVLGSDVEQIQRLRGQVLAAQGRPLEAIEVLEASLERLEQQRARYQTGRTLSALACVMTQVKDRSTEARACAERARVIFAELGARPDVQEVEELLAKI